MTVYAFLGWLCFIQEKYTFPLVFLIIIVVLHFFNGQYYMSMAIGNYHGAKALIDEQQRVKNEWQQAKKIAFPDMRAEEVNSTKKQQ